MSRHFRHHGFSQDNDAPSERNITAPRRPVGLMLVYLLRSPALIASTVLIAALLLARTLSDQPLMNGENMRLALDYLPTLQAQFQSGTYDSAPDDLRKTLEEELTALEAINQATTAQEADVTKETDKAESSATQQAAAAYTRYLASEEKLIQLGYLQEDGDTAATLASTAAERTFYERLSDLNDAQIYETPREEPALIALCDGVLSLSALLWYLPAVVAVAACTDLRARGRMLAQAPSIRAEARDEVLSAWLTALLASWCATVPAGLIALVNCGFGNPDYPVVCVWSGEVASRTVLTALGSAALLHALGSLLVVGVGTFVSLLVRGTHLGTLVAAGGLLGAASVFPLVVSAKTTSALPTLLPLPYLTVNLYVSRPQCAYFQELQPLAGTSLTRGFVVQAAWATAVLVGCLIASSRTRRNA